jgi:hypothetical protein
MEIVKFYRGERGNGNGHKLADILTWTDGALEMDHDWVQWVFPSNERSMLNGDAPTMTEQESRAFAQDAALRDAVRDSFVRFLDFLQFRLVEESNGEVVSVEPKDKENTPFWLRNFNHTMLRVTRLLKCLRLTGNTRYANAFYDALRQYKPLLSPNTWAYWHAAVFEPLWPEKLELS